MLIHRVYDIVLPRFRRRRFEQFLEIMKPSRDDTLLDIGGYAEFWTAFPPVVAEVQVLNIHEHSFDEPTNPDHHIVAVIGNGCDLDFDDASFSIVHSNSVIEHVGDLEAQRAFAEEARRVGRNVWVQTPAREFFFEPHFLTPFIHWLPADKRRMAARFTLWALLTRAGKVKAASVADEIRLLNHAEMQALFPDCEIRRERVLRLFTKSYIAVRNEPS